MVHLGLPGADSSGDWVGTHLGDMRDPLMALARHGMARSGACIGGGGWAWWNIAGVSSRGHRGALQDKTSSVRARRGTGDAHRAWKRRVVMRKEVAGEVPR